MVHISAHANPCLARVATGALFERLPRSSAVPPRQRQCKRLLGWLLGAYGVHHPQPNMHAQRISEVGTAYHIIPPQYGTTTDWLFPRYIVQPGTKLQQSSGFEESKLQHGNCNCIWTWGEVSSHYYQIHFYQVALPNCPPYPGPGPWLCWTALTTTIELSHNICRYITCHTRIGFRNLAGCIS